MDVTPLILRLQMYLSWDAEVKVVPATSHSGSRYNSRWRMNNIEEVDVVCNTSLSDPPDEEVTPFEYFKQMCRDEVIKTLSSSPICIVYIKQERH